jgi:hypothetical protein
MNGLHIVVSQPPEGVTDEEYNRWYDAHVDEILAVDGFSSVRRYRMEPVVDAGALPHRYIAVYETDRDPREAVAELERNGLGSKDAYAEGEREQLPLPPWFTQVQFASWNCIPLEEQS